MKESHKQNLIDTELELDLLSTPFEVLTNWHVITGTVCSGKTTLIDLLAGRGFQTVPEVGRKYVEEEIARGRTLEEIRANDVAFCYVITELTLALERELRPEDVLFLDRAFPDSLAFHQLHGLDPNKILPECFHHRYASVFILDRFPVQKDCARIEEEPAAEFLDGWLEKGYRALGYNIVRVPVLPPEERITFILNWLFEQGLLIPLDEAGGTPGSKDIQRNRKVQAI